MVLRIQAEAGRPVMVDTPMEEGDSRAGLYQAIGQIRMLAGEGSRTDPVQGIVQSRTKAADTGLT
jgi:hypothetical protein